MINRKVLYGLKTNKAETSVIVECTAQKFGIFRQIKDKAADFLEFFMWYTCHVLLIAAPICGLSFVMKWILK